MKLQYVVRAGVVLCALACAAEAVAQIRLPPVQLPPVPGPSVPLDVPLAGVGNSPLDVRELLAVRQLRIRDLLRVNRRLLESDPAGEPIVRGELLVLAPTDDMLDRARAQGYAVIRETALEGLGMRVVVLQAPSGRSTVRSLRRLRALDGTGVHDFNHVYIGSGVNRDVLRTDVAITSGPAIAVGPRVRVGLVDGGIDADHPVFRGEVVHRSGCAGSLIPSAHGTAVASILVGSAEPFAGVAPGSELFAADVYCGAATGGAVDAIAAALAWFARERVAVINVSLVGPKNAILESVIGLLLVRGHIVVAAVGNDGPASAPLYPAAYPGVIGVTAVDANRRVLLEANRGRQVAFAAPGADMAAASAPDKYIEVRGTSFAAPIVAGLLALEVSEPDPTAAARAVQALAGRAVDLGAPGKDDVYGYGLVGTEFRVEPNRVKASRGATGGRSLQIVSPQR